MVVRLLAWLFQCNTVGVDMDNMFNTLSGQYGAVRAMVPFSGNPDLEMSFIRLEGQTFAPLLRGDDSN